MHEAECIWTGDLTEDEKVRHEAYNENLRQFKALVKQFVQVQRKHRFVIIYK